MMLDLGAVAEQPLFVLGMALALIATKAAILFGLARLFRMDTRHALKSACSSARAASSPSSSSLPRNRRC
jgi:Kef-type K+ transport system membrane component KefB